MDYWNYSIASLFENLIRGLMLRHSDYLKYLTFNFIDYYHYDFTFFKVAVIDINLED